MPAKRITRKKKLADKGAKKYDKIREQVDQELPDLVALRAIRQLEQWLRRPGWRTCGFDVLPNGKIMAELVENVDGVGRRYTGYGVILTDAINDAIDTIQTSKKRAELDQLKISRVLGSTFQKISTPSFGLLQKPLKGKKNSK